MTSTWFGRSPRGGRRSRRGARSPRAAPRRCATRPKSGGCSCGGAAMPENGTVHGNGSRAILEIEDLHSYYGASHVVQGISLSVGTGEAVGLMGRNGVGKTTTLKSIMGLEART